MSNINVTPTSVTLVISNILKLYPGRMPFSAAANIAGYPTTAAAHTARARGYFPIRTRQVGSRLTIFTADVVEYLQTGVSQAGQSVAPIRKVFRVKTGRPAKGEAMEATRRGITVTELRAQASIKLEGGA